MVGIDRSYFTQIVNGTRRPSPDVAQKIAKELNFEWTIFLTKKVAKSHKIQVQTTLSGWESGSYEPTVSDILKLADVFQISVEKLLTGVPSSIRKRDLNGC